MLNHNLNIFSQKDPGIADKILHLESHSFPKKKKHIIKDDFFSKITFSHFYFILGVGDGEKLLHFYQRMKKPGERIFFVVVEKSLEKIKESFSSQDWSSFLSSPDDFLFVGKENAELEQRFSQLFTKQSLMMAAKSAQCLKLFLSDDLEESRYYEDVQKLFSQTLQTSLKKISSDPEDSFRGLMNFMRQIDDLPKTPLFDRLHASCVGKPGIVIASGPSLEKALPWLYEKQKKAVLFSVDSALPVLLKNNIKPHFVSCIERVAETVELFRDLPANFDNDFPWLIANPLVFPETLKRYPGPKSYLLREGSNLEYFFPRELIHYTGSSSAHAAYWGLNILGCNPIILVGQDLAFDRYSPKSHAAGIPSITTGMAEAAYDQLKKSQGGVGDQSSQESWVEGNNGKPILSWSFYIQYISEFREIIFKSGCETLNAIPEEYGAKIPGAQRVNYQDLDQYLKSDLEIRAEIKKRLELPAQEIEKNKRELQARLEDARCSLKNVFIPSVLKIMNDISSFYHEHLPFVWKDEYSKQYSDFFSEIEKKDQLLHEKNKFSPALLMNSFFVEIRIKTSFEINDIFLGKENISEKINQVVQKLQYYFQQQLVWSMRVLESLERVT